ncbi:hypothetical protein [Chelativorans salis]|uniref:Lipoprotein n=1 Tax=Chelativorans salis TaxID=2978478 RepID=A0ABT2LV81_9HYPH|nr:hypothetical protein [Chelativorans sp. EGI FJ00035]MCT7378443.1 hypothetical protein [Chelativorans sp. EGI FJ00035]
MSLRQFRLPVVPATAGIFMASLTLAGCVSSPEPEPQAMARSSQQTAPADLQLLCASAAASAAEAGSARVLPVSSRQLDAGNYQVDLDAAGKRMSCIVDSEGNVKSIQPSGNGGRAEVAAEMAN